MEQSHRSFVEHPPFGGYTATLNTVPALTVLIAECKSCGATREIGEYIRRRYSGHCQALVEIEKRLLCGGCGQRNAKLKAGYFTTDPPL